MRRIRLEMFGDLVQQLIVRHLLAEFEREVRFLRVWCVAITEVNRHLVEEIVVKFWRISVVAGLCDSVESETLLGLLLKSSGFTHTRVLSASAESRQYRRPVVPRYGT